MSQFQASHESLKAFSKIPEWLIHASCLPLHHSLSVSQLCHRVSRHHLGGLRPNHHQMIRRHGVGSLPLSVNREHSDALCCLGYDRLPCEDPRAVPSGK